MNDFFDELVDELRGDGVSVDAPFLHGLLTGYATIPAVDLDKLFAEITAKHPLSEVNRRAVIDAVGFLVEDLFENVFEAQFRIARDDEAQRWINGYLKAVELDEIPWQEDNENHFDAVASLLMFNSMIDDDFRHDPDMDLPGREDLQENPQLVTQIALNIFHCLNGDTGGEFDLFADDELPPLLYFSAEELTAMDEDELLAVLIGNEDRLPLEVIHECALRGDAMLPLLRRHLEVDAYWHNDANPLNWWGLLHAIFILGLIPGEASAHALLQAFRRLYHDSESDMTDWFSACWPALCRNKMAHTTGPMRQIADASKEGTYIRNQAVDCVLAAATQSGPAELDEALDWLAAQCSDESQDLDFRVLVGCSLLDHPRERHRQLMKDLVALQRPDTLVSNFFGLDEIDRCFDEGDQPEWLRFDDPWQFYAADEIQRRQARWLEESGVFGADLLDPDETEHVATYVREQPKIGRNDACPCGSGKKYKQCCLKKLH